MTYQAEVLADSPVAYWRLGDRGAGTVCADTSGNAGNVTYRSGSLSVASLLSADADPAVDAATDGIATGPASAALQAVSGTLTLEAWVRLDGTGAQEIIEHANASVAHFYLIADRPAGRWTFGWNDGTWRDHFFSYSFTTGATVHVCAVADATTAALYIDGALLSSQPQSGAATTWTAATVGLGVNPRTGGTVLDGVLDEVAVYDAALSATRIGAHYAAGTTAASSSSISLAGTLPAIQSTLTLATYTDTATGNRINGRIRNGGFVDESEEPVEPLPANLVRATKVDKALAYPTPTLVDGRPT